MLLCISSVILFILLCIYGISIIWIVNLAEDSSLAEEETSYHFYLQAMELVAIFGSLVSLLWLITLCSRCCAPCCCQLNDVQCPCLPFTMFHGLDVPFYVAVMVALLPVNVVYSQLYNLDSFIYAEGFFDFADVVMVVGMVILLVAIPASFVKWRKMTQRQSYSPSTPAQVIGNATLVVESAKPENVGEAPHDQA